MAGRRLIERIRLRDVEPPGVGPWWAFMMINVRASEETKKQTEIRLHTYPDLVQAVKNEEGLGDWAVVARLGPFWELDMATFIVSQWSDGTRGPGPRLAQGICLWHQYRSRGLQLWLIRQTRDQVRRIFDERRQLSEAAAASESQTGMRTRRGPGSITVREVLGLRSAVRKRSSLNRRKGRRFPGGAVTGTRG